MGDEATYTSENCKTLSDKVSNVFVSNRLCAREGESSDQQGSFVQCACSEQLSAVNTFKRVYGVDISHENCGHPNLAVVKFRDGINFISINHIRVLIVQVFEPTSEDARTDHLFRHV